MLSGALSIEDEKAVETELEDLISLEQQKVVDKLPDVPSDDLPAIITGYYHEFLQKYENI